MASQPRPTLVGFQIAVSSDHQVAVLDLLNHPCAEHIRGDVAKAGASGSFSELVAGIAGAELVAGSTDGELVRSSGVVGPAPLAVATATAELASVSPTITPPPPEMLHSHERAVLELVTAGYANQEIADRLRLSLTSVKSHIRAAYRKIDVTSRAEAVRWGLHHGAGC